MKLTTIELVETDKLACGDVQILDAKPHLSEERSSCFRGRAVSVIRTAVWVAVSFLCTSAGLILLLVSVMLAMVLQLWNSEMKENR